MKKTKIIRTSNVAVTPELLQKIKIHTAILGIQINKWADKVLTSALNKKLGDK